MTIPKLPLPPRTAQKSSGSLTSSTWRTRPSAVTSSTERTRSAPNPYSRESGPMPPPREKPTTPTWEEEPLTPARPWGAVAASTSAQRAPAPTRATRLTGSTETLFMRVVETNRAPVTSSVAPCAAPWTATGSPRSAAQLTAVATSCAEVAPTTISG